MRTRDRVVRIMPSRRIESQVLWKHADTGMNPCFHVGILEEKNYSSFFITNMINILLYEISQDSEIARKKFLPPTG